MKNKILLATFLFSLLIPIHFIFAFTPLSTGNFDLGGKYNPINVQIKPDSNAAQKIANTQKENYLKSTYGVSNYYKCSSTYDSSCGLTANLADPFTMTSCLGWIEFCLERKTIQQQKNSQPTQRRGTLCNGEYWNVCPVGNNFVCPSTGSAYCEIPKTNDQKCVDKFGPHIKWDGTKTSEGLPNCGCESGYKVSNDSKTCVLTVSYSGLPYGCSSDQGYSATNGMPCGGGVTKSTIICNGKEWSDCPVGQKFYCPPAGDAECILKAETKKTTPVTKKASEIKENNSNATKLVPTNLDTKVVASLSNSSFTQSTPPAGIAISSNGLFGNSQEQIDNMVYRLETEEVVIANKPEPEKPKSFWTRFIGWLGF